MIYDGIIRAPIGLHTSLYDPSQYRWGGDGDEFLGLWVGARDALDERTVAKGPYHPIKMGPPNFRSYVEPDGLSNRYVNDIARDGDYVWVATADGVSRLDLLTDTWERFNVKDGLPHRFATCVAVDEDSVWVGTRRGIARYRKVFVQEENMAP